MKKIFLTFFTQFFIIVCSLQGQTITTIAGGATGHAGYWGDGGLAILAQIGIFSSLAVDTKGNIYIADGNNERIRRVDVNTGIISTVAGTGIAGYNGDNILATVAQLSSPGQVALDKAGNFYISDLNNFRIRKVDIATGIISTVVGNGVGGYSGDGGAATAAQIAGGGAAIDMWGNLYFSDTTRIRKVDASGIITTVAGNGLSGCPIDGIPATASPLSKGGPYICLDTYGNVYFSTGDTCNAIHKLNVSTGLMNKLAGTPDRIGYPYLGDGIAATASHISVQGIAIDKIGNLYLAASTHQRIEKIDTFGIIHTIAGTGMAGFGGDGGLSTAAKLYFPEGVALDACDNVYIADFNNARVRKVTFNPSCNISKLSVQAKDIKTSISIYPNPVNDVLQIEATERINSIAIDNLQGQSIINKHPSTTKAAIDVSKLARGLYVVKTTDDKGNVNVSKMVKE